MSTAPLRPEDSAGDGGSSVMPQVPQAADRFSKWYKLGEIAYSLGTTIFPVVAWLVGGAFGGWVFGPDKGRWIAAGVCLLLVVSAVVVRYLRLRSDKVTYAIDGLKLTPILNTSQREYVAGLLTSLHRGDRLWFVVSLASAVSLIVILLWHPVAHAWRKELPSKVDIATVAYFNASKDQELLRRAPFFEAVYGNLNQEGEQSGRKYGIVLLETDLITHPTPPFTLKFVAKDAMGPGRYDLAGYAFRLSSSDGQLAYVPLQVSYEPGDVIGFRLPPCEPGDKLLCMFRLSVRGAEALPQDLGLVIRSIPKPAE